MRYIKQFLAKWSVFTERWAFKNQVTLALCSTLDSIYWQNLYVVNFGRYTVYTVTVIPRSGHMLDLLVHVLNFQKSVICIWLSTGSSSHNFLSRRFFTHSKCIRKIIPEGLFGQFCWFQIYIGQFLWFQIYRRFRVLGYMVLLIVVQPIDYLVTLF